MKAGDIFRVKFPFVRCEVDICDEDPESFGGFVTIKSWKPGVEFVPCGIGDDSEAVCDAEGEMVLTVVDVHKPGRFPSRVFYTRRWVNPDGKEFGKGALRITTLTAFKRRAAGYMHEYELRATEEAA